MDIVLLGSIAGLIISIGTIFIAVWRGSAKITTILNSVNHGLESTNKSIELTNQNLKKTNGEIAKVIVKLDKYDERLDDHEGRIIAIETTCKLQHDEKE